MKNVTIVALAASLLLGQGRAPQPALLKETESGQADAVCEGTRAQVRDMLVARGVSKGWTIDEATETLVRISMTEDSIRGSLVHGYRSQRRVIGKWMLLDHAEGVLVIGTTELVVQQAHGRERRIPVVYNAERNDTQSALWEMGCK